jgi:urea transport system permease protein
MDCKKTHRESFDCYQDGENRARFSGYNPATYKTFVYCISAGLAGLAGALFVPQVGIISPAEMGIVPSVEWLYGLL